VGMWWQVHHELGVSFLAKKIGIPPETEKFVPFRERWYRPKKSSKQSEFQVVEKG
jgi:hypothetical protein